MPTVLIRTAALVIFLATFNFIWAYLWYLSDASSNPEARVALPSFIDLLSSYVGHTRRLADVDWHAGLVAQGYERINSQESGFTWTMQRNWAYFPLQPYLSRLLFWCGITPIFTLLITSFLGVVTLTVACAGIVDGDEAFSDEAMRVALFILFFIISPLGLMTNFVVFAAALFVVAYLLLRRVLSSAKSVDLPSLLCAFVTLVACGLSRVQGMIFSTLIVTAFATLALCARPRRATSATLVGCVASVVLPIAAILTLFKLVANDFLAFQKIQIAWGRSLGAPWRPVLDAFSSGAVVNFGNGTEFPFTVVRLILFVCLVGVGLWYFVKTLRQGANDKILVLFDGCALLVGLVLILLPLMTSTLMSAHRYMTCAAFVVAVLLKLGWRPSWIVIFPLLLVRMAESVLFSRGYLFLIW